LPGDDGGSAAGGGEGGNRRVLVILLLGIGGSRTAITNDEDSDVSDEDDADLIRSEAFLVGVDIAVARSIRCRDIMVATKNGRFFQTQFRSIRSHANDVATPYQSRFSQHKQTRTPAIINRRHAPMIRRPSSSTPERRWHGSWGTVPRASRPVRRVLVTFRRVLVIFKQ
jgi:hypothetical protein